VSVKTSKYKLFCGSVLTLDTHKYLLNLAEHAKKLEFQVAQLKRERAEKDEYIKACEKRENDLIDRIRAGL
jgi:hypothetical protein